jgi:16S rRNA C967 or C1407 C5-methylase (RsmB/RsmF family)/NOL1/NOP2/fmu family ribosome biogenesis protein
MIFPEEFIKRISEQEYINTGSLLDALNEPSPVSIRINRGKWKGTPQDSDPVQWSPNGFYLQSRPSFTADPLYHSGCYYPQEASGMFLEQVVRQTIGVEGSYRILDLCGAPGGKTTILADLLSAEGLLVSNEVIRSRASILSETVTKWGSGNILVTQSDPSSFKGLPGFFDLILTDAPCSGEGMFRTEIARSEWSTDNTALCPERQKRILLDVWPSLKENGILIYSTCTFNPSENEEIISWLTKRGRAECIRIDTGSLTGITEIGFEGIFGYGLHPGRVRGEGFFIAAVRKLEAVTGSPGGKRNPGSMRPSKDESSAAARVSGFSSDRIVKMGDRIAALACDPSLFSDIAASLRVISPGTLIGSMKQNDFIPDHDLALSTGITRGVFPEVELSFDDAISYLRRDNLSGISCAEGWNLATFRSVPLGFVKNIGRRLNNYFPVEMRIRMNRTDLARKEIVNWI